MLIAKHNSSIMQVLQFEAGVGSGITQIFIFLTTQLKVSTKLIQCTISHTTNRLPISQSTFQPVIPFKYLSDLFHITFLTAVICLYFKGFQAQQAARKISQIKHKSDEKNTALLRVTQPALHGYYLKAQHCVLSPFSHCVFGRGGTGSRQSSPRCVLTPSSCRARKTCTNSPSSRAGGSGRRNDPARAAVEAVNSASTRRGGSQLLIVRRC